MRHFDQAKREPESRLDSRFRGNDGMLLLDANFERVLDCLRCYLYGDLTEPSRSTLAR